MEELAKRAVACRHWRWLPGMALVRRKQGPAGGAGLRPTHLRVALTGGHPCDPFACIADVDRLPRPVPNDPHWVPDLSDPATVGCLLALVREAWADEYIYCASSLNIHQRRWYRVVMDGDIIGSGRDECTALVAALEAVP